MKRKFISALLIAAMSMSVCSVSIFADDQIDPATVSENDGVLTKDSSVVSEGSEYEVKSSKVNFAETPVAPEETADQTTTAPEEAVDTSKEPETVAPAAEAVTLTGLSVEDNVGTSSITPAFDPNVTNYTITVQSDIYGVRVAPSAPEGSTITVNGEALEGENVVVSLPSGYEDYDKEVKQNIEIVVSKGDSTATYTVTVVRPDDNATYALFEEKEYVDEETGVVMPYEIYVPSNYDASKKYPVVFALHGSGQRSQSLDMVLKRYQMATVWAKDSEAGVNECIVLAPQCASKDDSDNWTTLMTYRDGSHDNAFDMTDFSIAAYNLLEKTIGEYSVDTDRIYMTGLSAGGFATYSIAVEHPETFAALVPVCGGLRPEDASKLEGIPMWIFHAADDPTVNPDEYLYPTLKALDDAGVEYKSTIYPAGEVFSTSAHFSWDPAYANKEMRDWVFAQSK